MGIKMQLQVEISIRCQARVTTIAEVYRQRMPANAVGFVAAHRVPMPLSPACISARSSLP